MFIAVTLLLIAFSLLAYALRESDPQIYDWESEQIWPESQPRHRSRQRQQ